MFFKKKLQPPSVLDRVEAVSYPAVICPFFGSYMPFVLKELNHAEIEYCGTFSLIETLQDKVDKKTKKDISISEMSDYSESMHRVVKLAMVNPTYDELMDRMLKSVKVDEIKKKMEEIEILFKKMKPGPEKKKLDEEYSILQMRSDFLLPNDFTSFVCSYALGVDKSDIKKVTEEMLFSAAVKAVKGHDNPSDHIHGNFSDFNKEDINNRAWLIYYDRVKKNNRR